MTDDFIRVEGTQFMLHGKPYLFTGTNMWSGAYLGAAGPTGRRERLVRELDMLRAHGITNCRVMASSEGSVLPAAVRPPILRAPGEVDEDLLCGLDFLLAELAGRGMHAVLYLTNFWDWSGGMSSYNAWTDGGAVPAVPGPGTSWEALVGYTATFYANERANTLYRSQVERIVERTNTINGRMYRDDPAIMAWQLANEPRPGLSGALGERNLPAFFRWLAETAAFIHTIDPHHLASTGSEGTEGCLGSDDLFATAHSDAQIDYLTFHLWPYNWRWFDPHHPDATLAATRERSRAYMRRHGALARRLGKPIVLEEFGLTRDRGAVEAGTPTVARDGFFTFVGDVLLEEMRNGSPLAGSNFWTWGGEGHAPPASAAPESTIAAPGDPPHEPQGHNSVYDTDVSTLAVVREHARLVDALRRTRETA
jgi:mannan endo-1,4-beta-mannosidase